MRGIWCVAVCVLGGCSVLFAPDTPDTPAGGPESSPADGGPDAGLPESSPDPDANAAANCPDFIPEPLVLGSGDAALDPADEALIGHAGFVGSDGEAHILIVAAAPNLELGAELPMSTDLALLMAYDYNVIADDSEMTFVATAGTVRFSELCDGRMAGTISDATFVEFVGEVVGGCTAEISSVDFAVGDAVCAL